MREGDGLLLLKDGIYERQKELHNLAQVLSESAQKLGWTGSVGRVAVIVLGAFVATQGVAESIVGSANRTVLVLYAACGLIIAAISGLEAASKTESRSAELKLLAATCQSTIWKTDSWNSAMVSNG